MAAFKLNAIHFLEEGKKIAYNYEVSHSISKYFNLENRFYVTCDKDVSSTPLSIAVIPLLANIMPIAWFAGFDVEVVDVDEDFYHCMKLVKIEYEKQYLEFQLKGELKAKKITKNDIDGTKTAMLFSGGVDAYATYIRIHDSIPDLITILGADIEIGDKQQWNAFTGFIESEKLLNKNKKQYIETNVRTFYTYHVELLLKDIGWWGKVQHGLSLLGSIAPLSYVNNYSKIYIASSYTEHIDIAWGSTPKIDENISWAGIKVHHDGYELKRQDKVDLITEFSTETNTEFKLRVCYSELRNNFNCSHCEKCYRTILGLVLNGKNPNHYGFKVDENFYSDMFEILSMGSASRGMQYFWWELMEKAKNSKDVFIFKNLENEQLQLDRIRNGELHELLENKINNPNRTIKKIKFILRNKFSSIYKIFKRLRS